KNVITNFTALFATAHRIDNGDADRLQVRPTLTIRQPFSDRTKKVITPLFAATSSFIRLIVTYLRESAIISQLLVEVLRDSFVQCWLVGLHRQTIIRPGVDKLLRDLGLTSHRIDGDQSPGHVQEFQ